MSLWTRNINSQFTRNTILVAGGGSGSGNGGGGGGAGGGDGG